MEGVNKAHLLTAWTHPSPVRHLLPSLACSCCSAGATLVVTGGVMAAAFRGARDLSLGGAALLALGALLLLCGGALALFALCEGFSRHYNSPKMSSAARANNPPDPLCLLPVYPSTCQVIVLPGGVEPVYITSSDPGMTTTSDVTEGQS